MFYLEGRFHGRVARWPVRATSTVVGRGPECGIVVDDPSVSRRHIRVEIAGSRVTVEDLQSRNGLWVNGERVGSAELGLNEWFVAGSVMMAIREGVTLGSSEGARRDAGGNEAGGNEAGGAAVSSPLTTPSARDSQHDTSSVGAGSLITEGITSILEQASGPEEVLPALLGLVESLCRADGAALVSVCGNGLCLHALRGEPLSQEQEDDVLRRIIGHGSLAAAGPAVGSGPDERPAPSAGEIVVHPVLDRVGNRTLLLVWPCRAEIPSADLRFVSALCGWWLDWESRLPVHAASQASSRGTDAEDGTRDRSSRRTSAGPPFIVASAVMRSLLDQLDRLAASELPVVLLGESGTGKELLSRRLHARSRRADGPFVAINCAALPAELLEAELFGIERGVATGVSARPGRFTIASGGTLLLDEVADMPLALQPKLLRALESREITPLGAPGPVPIDVRIVAATHQDLEGRVRAGTFRGDLLHRLSGATVTIPPLRDRAEEILPLARQFAREAAATQGRSFQGIDLDAARVLLGHSWPGNVRELRHLMHRSIALTDTPILHVGLLPPELIGRSDAVRGDLMLAVRKDLREARATFERFYFAQLLERAEGNLSEAARLAGVSRSFLYEKLQELGLRRALPGEGNNAGGLDSREHED